MRGRVNKALLPLLPVALASILACATTGTQAPATDSVPQGRPAPDAGSPPAAAPKNAPKHGTAPASPDQAQAAAPDAGTHADAADAEHAVAPDRGESDNLPEAAKSIRDQMQDSYDTGLEAWQAGRYDEAKGHFDRAVDVVLSSGLDLSKYPTFKADFDELVRDIADLDADLFSQESGPGPGETGSPLDSLKDITTFLSPEEAEREREKVQQAIRAITYDIPITLHPKVLAYIEAFQVRIRKEFEAGLQRSGGYLPLIKEIFREEGLPEDLAYMAHQESAFKTNAYSRARAKGMWQFMSFTGRKYGLRIDAWVDERSDFEKATRAAAAYLRDLYDRYDDWYLAMAAYNAGEGKIDRAVARTRTKDFWAIAKTRQIRAETKSYVPAILASILIDKSPSDYGFDTTLDPPLQWETVMIDKPTDLQILAEGSGATLDTIRLLNPELRGLVTPPNIPAYKLRVPVGTAPALTAHLATLPDDKRVSWTVHETKPGESFSSVARRYKVPVKALVDANPRYAGRRLYRGTLLNVPLVSGAVVPAPAVTEDRPTYEAGERIVHRVKSGDTLHEVATKYRTTVENLQRWNNLSGTTLHPGQRLVAYYGEKGNGPAATSEDSTPVASASVSASASASSTTSASGQKEYRVQAGDTLYSIARRFGAGLDDILRWNNLSRDSVIRAGQRLWVGEPPQQQGATPAAGNTSGTGGGAATPAESPAPAEHRVRRGDTLASIARIYDVTVQQVRSWNGIDAEGIIYPGQVLRIRPR
jgi:peptidoglycan lytic transglycosylase D